MSLPCGDMHWSVIVAFPGHAKLLVCIKRWLNLDMISQARSDSALKEGFCASSKDSNQTGWKPWLIKIFAEPLNNTSKM